MDLKPGDIVRAKHNGARGEVLEVAAGGARLRYEPGGPFGERGRKLGVWEHLVDLEPVVTIGPATSADLLELDAVPERIDSAAPAATYLPGMAPVGPDAETRPIRAGRTTDDIHARTLARART